MGRSGCHYTPTHAFTASLNCVLQHSQLKSVLHILALFYISFIHTHLKFTKNAWQHPLEQEVKVGHINSLSFTSSAGGLAEREGLCQTMHHIDWKRWSVSHISTRPSNLISIINSTNVIIPPNSQLCVILLFSLSWMFPQNLKMLIWSNFGLGVTSRILKRFVIPLSHALVSSHNPLFFNKYGNSIIN